jgi:hypothetical protein
MFNRNKQINKVFSKASKVVQVDSTLSSIVAGGKLNDAINGKWVLKQNLGWNLRLDKEGTERPRILVDEFSTETSSYIRKITQVYLSKGESLIASASLLAETEDLFVLTLGLFEDENLLKEVDCSKSKSTNEDYKHVFTSKIEAPADGCYYCLVQINLPQAKIEVKSIQVDLTIRDFNKNFETVRFGMRSFGAYTKASARLRCWKIGETLKASGHLVSMNSSASSDVVYYQKVKDLKHFKSIERKESRLLVFDFDDNYFLPEKGSPVELLSFINQMDIITVGSQYLYDIAKDYHPNLIILENPADIISSDVVKSIAEWTNNVGWFGAPENVLQLKLVDYKDKVTTVTRGGDIEFDIYTVDQTLTSFDLLLFPLEMTSWNSAKNANRLIKAVCLGIPVLASATTEHMRVADEFGLDHRFLVKDGESWQEKIDYIELNYNEICEVIDSARLKALEIYSVEKITENLFHNLFLKGKRRPDKNKIESDKFTNVHFISINFSVLGHDFEKAFDLQEVCLDSFKSVQVFADAVGKNKQCAHTKTATFNIDSNPLSLFQKLDEFIDSVGDEFLLFVDQGVSLLKPLIKHVRYDCDVLAIDLTEYEGGRFDYPRTNLDAHNVLLNKKFPKALLVKASWLRSKKLKASEMLSYFSMAIWFEALTCNDTEVGYSELPLGIAYKQTSVVNVSDVFYKNILKTNPEFRTEIPNIVNQWVRSSYDILQTLLSRNPNSAVSIGAKLLQHHYATIARGSK